MLHLRKRSHKVMGCALPQHSTASGEGSSAWGGRDLKVLYISNTGCYYLSHPRQTTLTCERKVKVNSPENICNRSLMGLVLEECWLN